VKRASLVLFAALIAALLAGCGGSPRSRAKDFARYLPAEVGEWQRNDDETVELLASTVTSKGHITMLYEGPDDAIAYVVVEVHPSEDAAEVAITSRLRDLQLQGLVFDRDRKPPLATASLAQEGRARYALLQEEEIAVEIDTLAVDEETPVSDENFDALLTMVRNAYAKALED
jgi:hypothetical protein